ncbi:DUF3761 domain-containing protein [Streptomyces sp. NPDC059112]|uniref:DUF3761 domain-containing protein n=1 Tax=Streptomyces sp. NPDC059112 TaxID=3346730 RepID=UPI0036AA4820
MTGTAAARRILRNAFTALVFAAALLVPAAQSGATGTCAHHTTGECRAGSTHPAGTTAQCKDGTYSPSAHFRGTCSGHGGVRYWYK